MITHLDLFSGIGGWALAASMVGGIRTIGFCEIEPFPRQVLAKHWPGVPIHEDITTLTPDTVLGWCGASPDLITASYPCQGFSVAGQRRGEADDRFLWPHVARLVAGLRPRILVAENVAGHVTLGLDRVLSDLESLDYAARAIVVPAYAVDARHRRDRVWILAHATSVSERESPAQADPISASGGAWDESGSGGQLLSNSASLFRPQVEWGESDGDVSGDGDLPYANHAGRKEQWRTFAVQPQYATAECGGGRGAESGLGGASDGVSGGMDGVAGGGFWDGDWERVSRTVKPLSVPNSVERLTAMGNAIVPQVAAEILRVVTGRAA